MNGKSSALKSTYLNNVRETLQEAESRAWKAETASVGFSPRTWQAETELANVRTALWQAETKTWQAETKAWQAETELANVRTALWQAETKAWQAETELANVRTALSQANEFLTERATRLRWLEEEVIPAKNAGLLAYATAAARIEALPRTRIVRRIQRLTGRLGGLLARLSRLD